MILIEIGLTVLALLTMVPYVTKNPVFVKATDKSKAPDYDVESRISSIDVVLV